MLNISPQDNLKLTFKPGSVFYFYTDSLVKTAEPHYFTIVALNNKKVAFLVCATTQHEKRIRHAERTETPMSTLVFVNPDKQNGLTKESLFDCNSFHEHTIEDFEKFLTVENWGYKGNLSDAKLYEIKQGVYDSEQIDDEKKAEYNLDKSPE